MEEETACASSPLASVLGSVVVVVEEDNTAEEMRWLFQKDQAPSRPEMEVETRLPNWEAEEVRAHILDRNSTREVLLGSRAEEMKAVEAWLQQRGG